MEYVDTGLATWGHWEGSQASFSGDPLSEGKQRQTKSPSPDPDPPIVIPPDWRSVVAHWPPERWSRWRRFVSEFLASLDEPATVEAIRGAERAAFDLLRTDGGLA